MFRITPYESAGPIRLGASEAALTEIFGQPDCIYKNILGEGDYQYPTFSVRLSAKERTVVEVGFAPPTQVLLGAVDIFNSPTAFEELTRADGHPLESDGFIVLLGLGITMTGFHDNDPSDRAVTVFARGRWDDLRPQLKEYVRG